MAMCGPLVLAMRLGRSPKLLLMAQLGRIVSYMVAGAAVAGASSNLSTIGNIRLDHPAWRWMLGLLIIITGFQLTGWWRGFHHLERWLSPLWQRLSQTLQPILPPRTLFQALLFGLLWGWLPCGLVYGVLLWALAQPSALDGALLMASFGMATLPLLLLATVGGEALLTRVPRQQLSRFSGLLVMIMGLLLIIGS
ncbi:MAG: sulfite exporter TauE/SafE family protein [Gammaproteobacteria bacterium]|nr:sulfite exporter TauE/SafE family protein [Gammaproteobacteria bacterium]